MGSPHYINMNSGEYWSSGRPNISRRFELAEKLSSSEISDEVKKIKTFFEQEMEDFHNLVWGIGIDTTQANQYRLKVYCPAFKDKSSADKLIVEISIQDYSLTTMMLSDGIQYSATPVAIPNIGLQKKFLSPGEILVDLSAINIMEGYRYSTNGKGGNITNTLTVKIKYPKLGEDISTFWAGFNADYFENHIIYTGVK